MARALDVVSGRWSLLIVRELLRGPARYGELQVGLPGISTNLLAERLRELEEAGVVQRQLGTVGNGVAYALTPWGHELRVPIAALVRWSTPLMLSGPRDDSFQANWLVIALEALLSGAQTDVLEPVGLEVDGIVLTVHIDGTGPRVTIDADEKPETVLRAEASVIMDLASGMLTVDEAIALGRLRGPKRHLGAVFGAERRVENRPPSAPLHSP